MNETGEKIVLGCFAILFVLMGFILIKYFIDNNNYNLTKSYKIVPIVAPKP